MRRRNLLLALTMLALPSFADAQVPPDIAAQLRAIGRVVDAEKTTPLFRARQQMMPVAGVTADSEGDAVVQYGQTDIVLIGIQPSDIAADWFLLC